MLLVTGCGPLGSRLVKTLGGAGEVKCACDKEHAGSECLKYDIKNSEEITRIVSELKPAKMVLTEEIPDIEYCERNSMYAMEYNTRGTRFFVEAGIAAGSRVTYVSTAYVFDGRKLGGMYTEDDKVNPINAYGETRLMGEVATDKAPDYLTFRMGEAYGNYSDNFVKLVYDSLKSGVTFELARDMYFSPIYIDDAAEAITKLVTENMNGLYNLAGPDRISQYEMGLKIAKVFGLKEELIVPLSADELGLTVRMPRDLSLDVSKIMMVTKIRGIDDGLKAMKKSMGV
jgi:dTDP-4-dehydrorhamnose reductase